MKDWWRKWTYEIPLSVGDALWAVLVVQFADFLSRLTIRRIIEFVVIAMLAMAFAQTFPIDLAILFAGDTLMYLEFVIAVRLAAGKIHFQEMLRLALRLPQFAMRAMKAASQPFRGSIGCASGAVLRARRSLATRPMVPEIVEASGLRGAPW